MNNHRICRLQGLIEYARHAERHFQSKKSKERESVYVDEGNDVYVIEKENRRIGNT